ncbi:MAG: winged helix DNA-binding domain-containing protein [Nocardioidaceae bacterium]
MGLHSTDPASVYLSAWARVVGLTHAEVDRALYEDRTLVKHMAMRRTLWAVATELLPVVQAAASDGIAATQRRALARDLVRSAVTADGERWLAEAEAAVVSTLAQSGPTLGRDLGRMVPALQTKVRGGAKPTAQAFGATTRVLTVLSAAGLVTRARTGGAWYERQPHWVLMSDWCAPVSEPPDAATARAELVRHWLTAFGPALFEDVKWWTGWTAAQTKAAVRDVGAVGVGLDDGGTGLLLPTDLAAVEQAEPWVALLPSLDPTTMGWKDRSWYLGPHRDRLFDRNGNAGPTVWSDGQVVGGWGQAPDGRVLVGMLADVGSAKQAQIDAEAACLTDWLAGIRIRPTFPTPLQQTLSE